MASVSTRLLIEKCYHIFRYSGILSAYGMALADVTCEKQETAGFLYNQGM